MNEIPFFSVVIPLYNKEKYIKRTLDSVLKQSFEDYEIIIVNDGSQDKSCEIVESMNDSRIRLIKQENGGPSKARNRGIKEANGKFIAFLDADDEWLSEKLERHYALHTENPDVAWSSSGYRTMYGDKETKILFHSQIIIDDAIDGIVNGLPLNSSTTIIKKEVFDNDRFFFNEEYIRSEDRELWYKMACVYPKVGYINTVLAQYNIGVENSLMNSLEADVNTTFITVETRIKYELGQVKDSRKKKLLFYLSALNTRAVINLWMRTYDFKDYRAHFDGKISQSLLDKLVKWNFLPHIIKKIFFKYWIRTHPLKDK